MLKFSLGDLLVLQWFLLLVQKKTRNPHSQVFQEVAEGSASSVFCCCLLIGPYLVGWGMKKKGCNVAEFRCDATSDITINLHKRFLTKPSLDGDQDGFLERKWRFFWVCKNLEIRYVHQEIGWVVSLNCVLLTLPAGIQKRSKPLRRFSSSLAILNRPTETH